VVKHGLDVGYRNAILRKVCDVVKCRRQKPLVWKKELMKDNNPSIIVEVEEGERLLMLFFDR